MFGQFINIREKIPLTLSWTAVCADLRCRFKFDGLTPAKGSAWQCLHFELKTLFPSLSTKTRSYSSWTLEALARTFLVGGPDASLILTGTGERSWCCPGFDWHSWGSRGSIQTPGPPPPCPGCCWSSPLSPALTRHRSVRQSPSWTLFEDEEVGWSLGRCNVSRSWLSPRVDNLRCSWYLLRSRSYLPRPQSKLSDCGRISDSVTWRSRSVWGHAPTLSGTNGVKITAAAEDLKPSTSSQNLSSCTTSLASRYWMK